MEGQTYFGWWCFTQKKDLEDCKEEFPGELKIVDDNTYQLRILGQPNASNKNLWNINEQESIPCIIGVGKNLETNKDEVFTLINSIVSGYRESNLTELVFTASNLIVGHQVEDLDNFKIRKLKVHTNFFEQWLNYSGLSRKYVNESEFGVDYQYRLPESVKIFEDDEKYIEIKFQITAPEFPLLTNVTISQSAYLHVVFKNDVDISKALKLSEILGNFMVICIGDAVKIDDLKMVQVIPKAEGETINNIFSVFRKLNRKYTNQGDIRHHSMLLPYSYIKDNISILLDSWINSYEKFEPALNLFFGKIYSFNQYEENAFLDIIIAIEVLHRIVTPKFDGKDEGYLKKVEFILSHFKQNEKKWLKKRLKRRSEQTLLNRLTDIYHQFSSLSELLFKNGLEDIEKITTTRNFLVHYEISKEFRSKIIPVKMLYIYTNKLVVIFQAMLLYHVSGDMKLVEDRIDKSTINKIYIRYRS